MKLLRRLAHKFKQDATNMPAQGIPVQDKYGETFWLRAELYEDGGHVIWLGRPGDNIGSAKLFRDKPTSCLIGDLYVVEGYRNRGLGTLLLNEVIRLGVVDSMEVLWGWVRLADFLTTKHLLDWYSSQGFVVRFDKSEIERLLRLSPSEQGQLITTRGTTQVAHIHKTLKVLQKT